MTQNVESSLGISRFFIVVGAILAGLSVVIGAFGAHALSAHLTERGAAIWGTGVQYQMFHSVAMIVIGILLLILNSKKLLKYAGFAFLIGTILFSGSLYLIALLTIKNLGLITPLGGLFFVVGWLLLISAAMLSTRIRI